MQQVYITTDGQRFDTQEEAIAHEGVTEAYKGYQDAVAKLQRAIGEKLVTADGHPFTIGGHTNYYYVTGPFTSTPRVVDVVVSFYNFEVDKYNHKKIQAEYYDGEKMNKIVCEIDQLYNSSKNAYEKVIELLEGVKIGIDDQIRVIEERCL